MNDRSMNETRETPILFLIFNRPETTRKVFEQIRKIKPRRLFVAADGPRTDKTGEAEKCRETRDVIGCVDWDCEVKTLFRDRNLGCKRAVSSAISWFYEQVEAGIVLEDDCLPSSSFFSFCAELLRRYADDERVMMISGDNFQDGIQRGDASYYFSQIPHIWGWATWRRAWNRYDVAMSAFPEFLKAGGINRISTAIDVQNFWLTNFVSTYEGRINTWDYQWVFAMFLHGGLSICPQVNMISNIGFGGDSTHTADAGHRFANMARHDIGNVVHPDSIKADLEADAYDYRMVCDVGCHSKRSGFSRWRKVLRKRWKTGRLLKEFRARHDH